jgi:hypothetical protein
MDAATELGNRMIEHIKDEWTLAGHALSGAFEQSLAVEKDGDKIHITGNTYGIYMNFGVRAENIPYTPRKRGQGKGGTSKYITGLHNYVKARIGITDEKESLSIAFAIAYKHSQEGIQGSGFLDKVRTKFGSDMDVIAGRYFDEQFKDKL